MFYLKKFGDPIKGANDGIDKAIMETLAEIATQAKGHAPVAKVNGGRLKNSIMYQGPEGTGGHSGDSPQLSQINKPHQGYVGTALDYGVYQEFGTRKMKPKPFLRPAIALSMGKSKEEVKNKINESVKKFTKDSVTIVDFF